jgi:hypothetical protein
MTTTNATDRMTIEQPVRSRRDRIRQLNDDFRTSGVGGLMAMTPRVRNLGGSDQAAVIAKVQSYDDFNGDNDPYGTREFGIFDHGGIRYYWKIDYYDPYMIHGSEDPCDPMQTLRVLTILLASEY